MSAAGAMSQMSSEVAQSVHAAQRVLSGHIDLLRLDAVAAFDRSLRVSKLVVLGTLGVALGWALEMAAVVLLLRPTVPAGVSLAVIGGVHLVAGLALMALARRART